MRENQTITQAVRRKVFVLYLELARRQKGWSQRELGEHPKVKIDRAFISLIERGMGLPVPAQAARLAAVLDVPVDLLLQHVPPIDAAKIANEEDKDAEQAVRG
jgi:transcriptional regulator with XRE-family HTH domain